MIETRLVDGRGQSKYLRINSEGEASVVVHPHPPKGEQETALPYRARFADSAGATSMVVDGSSTNVEYSVSAGTERDIYIKYISLAIGDGGSPELNKFGAVTALTNGVQWTWNSQELGAVVLHDGIKTNLEFVRMGNATGAIGTGVDAYLAEASGGGAEKTYLPSIDLAVLFGLAYGIRLRVGTTDKITFTIRDNLTSLLTLDAIAYGLQI
jgi:hypothetical protein